MSPHLFGLEVKQGKAHATTRQLSRLVWLRKHRVNSWIVRSPQEALMIIDKTLEGVDMATFDDNLLAELDAALMGGPAPTPENGATAQPEALPDFSDIQEQADADQNAYDLANGTATLPTVDDLQDARDAGLLGADVSEPDATGNEWGTRSDVDAMERQADAMEAIVLELSRLNQNLLTIMELLVRGGSAALPPQAEPVQTAAAPAPRRRRAAPEPQAEASITAA